MILRLSGVRRNYDVQDDADAGWAMRAQLFLIYRFSSIPLSRIMLTDLDLTDRSIRLQRNLEPFV
jgi:hypothetical protein